MLDPDGSLIPVFQMAYLWGFLVPFGWCAFVNLSPQRIAYLLLIASGLSCLVAIGQFTGYMPTLPTQKIIDYKDSSRAAGLVLQCNSLTMALTPCFLLLPHIRQASLRILMLLLLLGGIASTVSKSAIMIVPGLLFYFFWREPEKGRVLRLAGGGQRRGTVGLQSRSQRCRASRQAECRRRISAVECRLILERSRTWRTSPSSIPTSACFWVTAPKGLTG